MITRRSLGAGALGLLASQTLLADLFAPRAAASTLPLGLDRFSSTLSADGKTRMLCGLEIDLDQSSVPQTTNLIVEADIVTINGAIRMPGQSFAIVARRIECKPGAQIDTSGATGSPDYMIAASDGPDFGKNGADGRTGGTGQSGGDVTIVAQTIAAPLVVVANGGKGGNAESGGTGAAGQPGRNWQMGWGKGEDGKVGGQGGLAGAPGAGGKAGAISVLTFDDSHAKVVATAHGGPPGAQGKNGLPGPSGAGGNGGQHDVKSRVCGDR